MPRKSDKQIRKELRDIATEKQRRLQKKFLREQRMKEKGLT